MSEWGNPPAYGRYSCKRERTQGSETSQYLEEKKAKNGTFFLIGSTARLAITIRKKVLAIPLVAASEKGRAQTIHVYMGGVVGQ
jgi:hypothetical protein